MHLILREGGVGRGAGLLTAFRGGKLVHIGKPLLPGCFNRRRGKTILSEKRSGGATGT